MKSYYDQEYFQDSDTYQDYFNYAQAVSDLKYCPRLERISRTVSDWNNKRVLEIGCAAGGTLLVLRHWGAEVSGIEISEAAVSIARERFSLEVFCGPVERAPLALDGYHAILAFDVLEHLSAPGEVLERLTKTLLPNGFLALTVPNFDRYTVDGMKWPGMQSYWEHLNYFSSRLLTNKLAELGLTMLDSHTFTTAPPPVESLCHKRRELGRRLRSRLPILDPSLRLLRRGKFLLSGSPPLDIRQDASGFDLFMLAKKNGV